MSRNLGIWCLAVCLPGWTTGAWAAWNPAAGDWTKANVKHVRIMTWNIQDSVCSTADKSEGFNSWTAVARIVAAMKPDVLLIQEAGDNSGNGTGSGADSVGFLATTFALFMYGGPDPFKPGNPPVTAFVQKYDPTFDLPYVFVSGATDNFNRNVILSRFPFIDLNGDGKSVYSDIPFVVADAWADGGNGGIRGFGFVELDLPDVHYLGDLVVGNAHLKAGGTASDKADRLKAAKNVSYVIQYWYNGNGGSIPDPNAKLLDLPPATSVLGPHTPVVIGGDWNEDEFTNGTKGPAAWLTQAAVADAAGGTDGTDRDGSDMTFDNATHPFTGSNKTQSNSKLDYIAWQDSIVDLQLAFLFNTSGTPPGALPPELADFAFPGGASGIASDHRPVIVDLALPLAAPYESQFDYDQDNDVDLTDYKFFYFCQGFPIPGTALPGCQWADSDGDLDVDLADFAAFQREFHPW